MTNVNLLSGGDSPYPITLGRPLATGIPLGPRALGDLTDELIGRSESLARQGGGLLAVAYPEHLADSLALTLSTAIGALLLKQRVRLYRPLQDAELKVAEGTGRLVVLDFPCDPSVMDVITQHALNGLVVIATGTDRQWQRVRLDVPMDYVSLSRLACVQGASGPLVADVTALSGLSPLAQDLLRRIASLHAWGVAVPWEMLIRSVRPEVDLEDAEPELTDAVTESESQGVLCWVEMDDPPAVAVVTRSSALARAVLAGLPETGTLVSTILGVLNGVDPESREHRLVPLKLLQAVLACASDWPELSRLWGIHQSHRAWVRGLYQAADETLDRLLGQITPREALLWARVLADLGEHPRADAVLRTGLAKEPANPALLQSRARHLGRRALADRNLEPAAKNAFDLAIRQSPDNPYVLQARGVWAADLGDLDTAGRDLQRALHVARAPADTVYTLIALADLSLARGRPDDSDYYLERAAAINPGNPYIPHLRGEAARWRGDFDAARAAYLQTQEIDPHNVPAAQSLGDMALKRGQWALAELHLTRALEWQPDNVPALHAFGELRTEQAIAAAETGQPADVLYSEAERAYRGVLEIEPGNLHALLALGVLLARQRRHEDALSAVDEAERRGTLKARVRALHVRGLILLAQGQSADAEQAFKMVLDHDRGNVPALVGLAKLANAQGRDAHLQVERIREAISAAGVGASDDIQARNALAALLRELGDLDGAIAILRDSQKRDQANAYTWMELARALSARGDASGADAARARSGHLRLAEDL